MQQEQCHVVILRHVVILCCMTNKRFMLINQATALFWAAQGH